MLRDPLVYCFEEVDNGENLHVLQITDAKVEVGEYEEKELGGIRKLYVTGVRLKDQNDAVLYSEEKPVREEVRLTAIPYYAWGNRGENGMRVWMQYE